MTFDQLSRYKACGDILRRISKSGSILDVGSGLSRLLGDLFIDRDIVYVDPRLTNFENIDDHSIAGDVFDHRLDNCKFDYVCSIDTLEHVPVAFRKKFIDRISELAEKGIILGFPCSDDVTAYEADLAIDNAYHEVYGKSYPWLEEHFSFGLPSRESVVNQLRNSNWTISTIGHGHAPWLKSLLSLVTVGWEMPETQSEILKFSQQFMDSLYKYDFNPPFYRWYIVATRTPEIILSRDFSSPIDDDAIKIFADLYVHAVYATIKSILNSNDSLAMRFVNTKAELNEIAVWSKELQSKLNESNRIIEDLKSKAKENNNLLNLKNEVCDLFDFTRKIRLSIQEFENVDIALYNKAFNSSISQSLMNEILNITDVAKDLQLRFQNSELIIDGLKTLNNELNANCERLPFIQSQLDEIYNSKAWKLILLIRKVRLFLIPVKSYRERFAVYSYSLFKRFLSWHYKIIVLYHIVRRYLAENGIRKTCIKIVNRLKAQNGIASYLNHLQPEYSKQLLKPLCNIDSYKSPPVIVDYSAQFIFKRILSTLELNCNAADIMQAIHAHISNKKYPLLIENLLILDKFIFSSDEMASHPIVKPSEFNKDIDSKRARHILFITAQAPSPFHGGGNRIINFIKILNENNKIYLCTCFVENEDEPTIQLLEPYCESILKIPYWQFGGNQTMINKWLDGVPIDIVHYEWPLSLLNYDSVFGKYHVFTYMEAVSLRLKMELESLKPKSSQWIDTFVMLIEMLRIELVDAASLQMRIAVTMKDAQFFNNIYSCQEYAVINHGLNFDEFVMPNIESEPLTLLFIGNYGHPPNDDAMRFFFDCIWKDICKEVPEVRIYLVGANPPEYLYRLTEDMRIIVTGKVPDVRPYIQRASVCIAPLISGAGLRGKIIEYAALQRTFVATSIAMEDLAFIDGIDYFCADNSHDFSKSIVKLLQNESMRNQMALKALETARLNYDTRLFVHQLNHLYEYMEKK